MSKMRSFAKAGLMAALVKQASKPENQKKAKDLLAKVMDKQKKRSTRPH